MSILQVLIEIEPFCLYFLLKNQDGPYFKQMNRMFAEAYRNPTKNQNQKGNFDQMNEG